MEPFSMALGIISVCTTTASILSFLASTVGAAGEKSREWSDCRNRLRAYRCHMDTCRQKLEAWKTTWFDSMRTEDDYVHFWGREGFRGIEERIEIIEDQCLGIKGCLPSEKEHAQTAEDPTFFAKIAFTLVKSAGLKDRITRMKEMLADLEDYSMTNFSRLHDCDPKRRLGGDVLTELVNLKAGSYEFTDWMCRLHAELLETPDSWGLLLQIPTEKDAIIPDEADLTVDFLIEQQIKEDHINFQRRSVVYNRESAGSPSALPPVPTHTTAFPHESISIVRRPFSASVLTHTTQRTMQKERSITAVGLATWTFPLAQTAWTIDLCSCVIHLALFHDSVISVLSSSRTRACAAHQRSETLRRHTFLHLGTTLAELVLAEPLGIGLGSDQVVLFRSRDEVMQEMTLLRKIKRKSLKYMEAVRYCFELDREMQGDAERWAQDTDRFVIRVIKPLREYSKRIEAHSKASEMQAWYRSWVSREHLVVDRDFELDHRRAPDHDEHVAQAVINLGLLAPVALETRSTQRTPAAAHLLRRETRRVSEESLRRDRAEHGA